MKALTIWQPWASLIIAGVKPWEWRGWPAPRTLVGRRIAIHAGARPVKADEVLDILRQIAGGDSSLLGDLARRLLLDAPLAAWPRSSVLGSALLGEPIAALAWAEQHLAPGYDSSRIDHHKFAWPLTDIERFEPPVPARGAQGLWDWHG